MKLLLGTVILASSFSAFALEMSSECQNKLLAQLKSHSIATTYKVATSVMGNLYPVVGAVCKNEEAFKVKSIDKNSLEVTAIVNPWSGQIRGLRATCNEVPLDQYPVNVIKVENTKYEECRLTLTSISSVFTLDD